MGIGTSCHCEEAQPPQSKNLFPNSYINLFTSKKAAFTLAEVLITLGIIGVVAAMTIPTLISNYKTKEASVRLKKFYSMMNQAIQLSTLDNGQTSAWTYPGNLADTDSLETFWNIYFAPYLRTSAAKADSFQYNTDSDGNPMFQDAYKIYFQDGSILAIRAGGAVDMHYDVNGESAPNRIGRDIHLFLLYRTGNSLPTNMRNILERIMINIITI